MRKKIRSAGILLIVLTYLFLAYIGPMGAVIGKAFSSESPVPFVLSAHFPAIRFSFKQALISAFFTLLLGIPGAWVFSAYQFKGKRTLNAILSVPFMLPTVIVAAGFNALLGQNGWLNLFLKALPLKIGPIRWMNTFQMIILAHVFYNTSLVIRVIGNAWTLIDSRILDAARTLGASRRSLFTRIIFPLLRPSMLSAALLTFLFDFSSYGVILLLGGPRFRTIETEIANQALQMLDLRTAGILSLIQIAFTLLIVLLERKLSKESAKARKIKVYNENLRLPGSFGEKCVLYTIVYGLLIFTVLPLAALMFRSFWVLKGDIGRSRIATGFSLAYYRGLFENARNSFFYVAPGKAILFSARNAACCALLSLGMGLLMVFAAREHHAMRILENASILPIGTSAVTLGLGYLLFYRKAITSFWVIPIAHSLIALPFVVRTLEPAVMQIPQNLHDSAAVLGADPRTVFRKIDLPVIRKAILNACIFAFTISMGEFGATSFLSRPDEPTLTVAIYQYLSKPGGLNYGQAMAMATILMLFCFAAIYFMNRTES